MIFVLTGNGKGKTTSAIGMGVRAAGAGKRVLMIQFLKAGGYSEEKAIAGVNNFKIKSFGRSCFVLSANELQATEFPPKAGTRLHSLLGKDFELAKQGWEMAKNAVAQNECDFLILDEINLAIKYGLLDEKEIISFLKKYGSTRHTSSQDVGVDIVLTGRDCPQEIIEIADLVTEMKEIKHPYQKGAKQKKGIEF